MCSLSPTSVGMSHLVFLFLRCQCRLFFRRTLRVLSDALRLPPPTSIRMTNSVSLCLRRNQTSFDLCQRSQKKKNDDQDENENIRLVFLSTRAFLCRHDEVRWNRYSGEEFDFHVSSECWSSVREVFLSVILRYQVIQESNRWYLDQQGWLLLANNLCSCPIDDWF